MKESRTPKLFGAKKTFAMEIATKPLVMASEVAGLEPLNGYIKLGNGVMPVRFALTPLRKVQAEFIARKMTVPEPRPVPQLVPEPTLNPSQQASASKQETSATKDVVVPESPQVEGQSSQKEPSKLEKPKSPFERKNGTVNGTAPDWNESHWID